MQKKKVPVLVGSILMTYIKMKNIYILTLVLVVFITSAGAVEKWDMPTPYADGVHHTKNIKIFVDDIIKNTGGNFKIVVHSGASLFKHAEIYRAVRTGQVPIGELFMGMLGNENNIFKADNIPFLASSFTEAKNLWKVTKSAVEKHLKKDGLMLLYVAPWTPQGFYTKKKINNIKDLQGVKMRVYSPTTSRLATLLKAEPITVQTPDIPQAFSTGIIDAMVTSSSTGVSSAAWNFVNYYTDTQAWIPKNMVVVNIKSFQKLNKKNQMELLKAASFAEARGWELAPKETRVKTNILSDKGIIVSSPSSWFQKELKMIGNIMVVEWAKDLPQGAQILKQLK